MSFRGYALLVLFAAVVNEFSWWHAPVGTQGDVRVVTNWVLICTLLLGVHLLTRNRFLSAVLSAIGFMSSTTALCSIYWLMTRFVVLPGQEQCSKQLGIPLLAVSAAVALAVFWRWDHGKRS